jgi:hypothetical protein
LNFLKSSISLTQLPLSAPELCLLQNAGPKLRPEMPYQTLHRTYSSIPQSTNGVSHNLFQNLLWQETANHSTLGSYLFAPLHIPATAIEWQAMEFPATNFAEPFCVYMMNSISQQHRQRKHSCHPNILLAACQFLQDVISQPYLSPSCAITKGLPLDMVYIAYNSHAYKTRKVMQSHPQHLLTCPSL